MSDQRSTDVTSDPSGDQRLDGNAVAGVLAGLFGEDITVVPGRCDQCGTENVIGAMRAFVRSPGIVLRCPACDGVVLRVVETRESTYLDVRGAAFLRFTRR